jgi:GntR family transcriptional regulator/MocR family aminotransferase
MDFPLERDPGRDGRPVYRQIADHLLAEIAAGRFAAGARLPAIRDLARDLSVNRDTVALAYESLANAGAVESTVGRGTFVRSPSVGTVGAGSEPEPLEFSPMTERLLDLERTRPKFGSASDAIPMHSLVPDPSLFPVEEFRKVLGRVLQEAGPELLLYGGPQGYLRLREVLAQRLHAEGIDVSAEEVVACHGASQGIHLATRMFAEAGDAVALEEPTYNNVLAVMRGLGLKTVPVPLLDDGLDLDVLDATLARPEVKFLYTIPTFHNPTGVTTNLEHRRALLEIAARHRKPVLEDAYEMDLRITGKTVPSLAALDRAGLVVHLFSFSKSLFPGARVGAISVRGRMVDALVAQKQATDLSDSMLLQAALAEFVADGHYDRHLRRLRRVLLERRDALLAALEREMPEGVKWTRPDGGYQVWVELPDGIDTGEMLADSVGAGLLFAPGFQFNHDGRRSNRLRLTFAMAGVESIERGVATLARLVGERLANGSRRATRVHI